MTSISEEVKKLELSYTACWNANSAASVDNTWDFFQESKYKITICSSNFSTKYIPKKIRFLETLV